MLLDNIEFVRTEASIFVGLRIVVNVLEVVNVPVDHDIIVIGASVVAGVLFVSAILRGSRPLAGISSGTQ